MKSCPNVHAYWSSNRVPDANVLMHRVPVEFPIYYFRNLISEHLPSYSCKKNENNNNNNKGNINANRNTTAKKIHGSYN